MRLRWLFPRFLTALLLAAMLLPVFTAPAGAGTLTLSVYTGPVGTSVQVSGSGYLNTTGNYAVNYTVYFDAIAVKTESIYSGNLYPSNFTVPAVAGGAHSVSLRSGTGETSNTVTFTVTPRLTGGSPTSGPGGTSFSSGGDGFTSGSSVSFSLDGSLIPGARATAGADGTLAATLTLPAAAWGAHRITAGDGSRQSNALTFTVTPEVTMSQNRGSTGDGVSLSGSGFAPGAVRVLFDGSDVAGTTATADGSFTETSFSVPSAARGEHTVSVRDAAGHTVETAFEVSYQASINPASGTVGTSVTFNGTGFSAALPLRVSFGGADINSSASTTDADGAFSGTFTVPGVPAGSHLVAISDGIDTATADFRVVAKLTASAGSGSVGDNITLRGAGFTAGSPVRVSYDGREQAAGTIAADGSFNLDFTVPPSPGGDHTLAASDGVNNLSSVFTMETVAPPVPEPLSPPDAEKGEPRQSFTWLGVADASGVSYTLEISADDNFRDVVLTKTGLPGPNFSISEAEALEKTDRDAAYYWRVRAVDGAENVGQWSDAWSFRVVRGLRAPTPGNWVITGLTAALALVIGFFVGRRTAYY